MAGVEEMVSEFSRGRLERILPIEAELCELLREARAQSLEAAANILGGDAVQPEYDELEYEDIRRWLRDRAAREREGKIHER